VEEISPFARVASLASQVTGIVSSFDVDALPSAERDILRVIKRQVVDVRLDIRDYGMAETKLEQERLAKAARSRLERFERNIVKAGEYGLLGPADIAQLSAEIQQLIADL
jgi:hypothetical protein